MYVLFAQMMLPAILAFICVAVSAGVLLARTSRRGERADIAGIAAIAVVTIVAGVVHTWLFRQDAAIERMRLAASGACMFGLSGDFEKLLLLCNQFLVLPGAFVAPISAAITRSQGGRWHHALVSAVAVVAPSPLGPPLGHFLLLAAVALLLGSRAQRPWLNRLLPAAMVGLWCIVPIASGSSEAGWFFLSGALLLAVPFAALMLPGRMSERTPWTGWAASSLLITSICVGSHWFVQAMLESKEETVVLESRARRQHLTPSSRKRFVDENRKLRDFSFTGW